jgi:hypothetical protein
MGTKRTIEIEDTLQECVDGAIEAVKDELLSHLEQNPDTESLPDWGDLDYSGALHEIIDGAVPIYTSEIKDIFYLHGDDVEQAFDDAGIGEKDDKGWPMGWHAAAIYCYIERQAYDWYAANAAEVFEEWQEKQQKAE